MGDVTIVTRNAYSGLDADKPASANIGDTYSATDSGKQYRWDGTAWIIRDTFASQLLHVRDEKADGVAGGTFTQNIWQTRDLQTVKTNEISGASLAANQITLPAGTYFISGRALAHFVDGHKIKIRNITDGSDVLIGLNGWSGTAASEMIASFVSGRFTLAATKVLELQHRCTVTRVTNGFGLADSFGVIEVYSDVQIWKVD